MTSPFFTEKLAGQDVSDFHLFVTTHPYMIELGLGTFTTGTLYDWWNEQTNDGFYLNRLAINESREKAELQDPPNKVDKLLGITDETEFFWRGWKPNKAFQNAGVYKQQDLSDYDSGYGGSNPWEFDSAVGTVDVGTINWTWLDDTKQPILGGTLDGGLNFVPTRGSLPIASGDDAYEEWTFDGVRPVYDLINLNRFWTSFENFYPRSLWDKDDADIGGENTDSAFASHELLTEIKSSKVGPYIEWSGEITFYINENNGTVKCPITEWVPFKLYLFDESMSQSANKAVTIKKFTYVAPKRDVTGKLFSGAEDGGHVGFDPDNEAAKGAGDMDMSFNTVTRKWESGSPTLFAKMVTAIGKPQAIPSVQKLIDSDIQEDLDSDDYEETKFIPASGTAMPIRPQNGNPLQWQPNYLEPDDVRCETGNKEKETLTVYNFNRRRGFDTDEEVLLTRIDGVWHVSDPGGDFTEPSGQPAVGAVGRWGEFSYMMTNSDYFFKNLDGSRFSPREAEQSFHRDYYLAALDANNVDYNYGTAGGYDPQIPFTNSGIKTVIIGHGYAQTTSFDYLDSKLFGIRGNAGRFGSAEDKCSIATTNGTINAAGKTIPPPNPGYASRNAAHSTAFFGCLFPAGYAGLDEYLETRNWNVKIKGSGTMVNGELYLKDSGNNSSSLPFAANNGTSDRNVVRKPFNDAVDADLTEDNNYWFRRNTSAAASLFYQYVENNDRSFSQMPADVMLNASPEGEFGSPLYPIHRFKNFHTTTVGLREETHRAFLKCFWLGKEGLAGSSFGNEDSAFDFQPVSRNNIMFRPLKLEGYVQFGDRMCDANSATREADTSQNISHNDRVGFSVEAHRAILDSKRPATQAFEDREQVEAPDYWTDYGLKWGGEVEDRPNYQNLHRYSYMSPDDFAGSDGALKWTVPLSGEWEGAAAFGVIATYNTVSASQFIDFTTTNQYGFGAVAWGEFLGIGQGYENQNPSWGVGAFNNPYRQENITDLSVRIFHEHPRSQTLFDPRTYAVHHFNPDVRYAYDSYVEDDGTINALSPVRNLDIEDDISGRDAAGNPISFSYEFPLPSSTVDFQETSRYAAHIDETFGGTLHADSGVYQSVAVPIGQSVFSDATYDGSDLLPPIMASKFWQVNTTRVGKLLPFRYIRKDRGIPCAEGDAFTLGDGTFSVLASGLNPSGTPALDLYDKMVVKSSGEGYSVGNKVGSDRFGISFTVASVGPNGAIGSLECQSAGTGINAANTAGSGDVFTPETNGQISLDTVDAVEGLGFDAYYISARVYETFDIDAKPGLLKRDGEEVVRIAADVSQPNITSNSQAAAEAASFINTARDVSYTLDPANLSPNSLYDVFFHFHNDISMTWMASEQRFHGSLLNNTEAHEQYIGLRINPR